MKYTAHPQRKTHFTKTVEEEAYHKLVSDKAVINVDKATTVSKSTNYFSRVEYNSLYRFKNISLLKLSFEYTKKWK